MPIPSQNADTVRVAGAKRKRMSLLDIASELERRLPLVKGDNVAAASLADEVRRRIKENAGDDANSDVGTTENIGSSDGNGSAGVPTHQAGVRLWNLVLRLVRDTERAPAVLAEYRRLLLHGRVFAFITIHCSTFSAASPSASAEQDATQTQLLYLLGIAIRAGRSCIDEDDVELGHIVLEKAATYRRRLEGAFDSLDAGEDATRRGNKFRKFESDLIILQIAQLWKEGQPQDLEKLYANTKTTSLSNSLDRSTAEDFAMTLFDVGKSLLLKREFPKAIKWLERASDILAKQGQAANFSDGLKALRVSITHALAVASLRVETTEGHKRAAELVQNLRHEAGDEDSRVQLIQLELFSSSVSETFEAEGYASVLFRMVERFNASPAEFQLLHHHIQKLHNKSPGLGCSVLDEFMLALRHKDNCIEWIEKLIITRIWLLANQREAQEELDAAERVLSKLRMPISADTAAAAQTLMWKRIEQGYQERQYSTAIRWCRLALCHIFESGGRPNRALIERKLFLCSVESNDLETAKSVYTAMAETTQDEPVTKYLLYKFAIKANDLEIATECLRAISTSAKGKEMLYACALHAQHSKAPRFMVQALKKLADTINHNDSAPIHTPALFRCTVLMLRDMIDGVNKITRENTVDKDAEQEAEIDDLSSIFEGVVEAVESSRSSSTDTERILFNIDELEWFCRAAYNLGLKFSGQWDLRHTVRILETCVKIIKLLPTGEELSVGTDIDSKTLNCHFLVSSALAALARRPNTASNEDQALKDYHVMREHIRAFQTELKASGKLGGKPLAVDMLSKLSVLLVFDFEGALALGDWDELENICERAVVCQNADTFRVLGDCLLRFQASVPSKTFVSTMRFIVSKLHELSKFGGDKLVKYYRCLFQAALYRDNETAFQILEEVCHLAQEEMVTAADDAWPEDELQFLAVTAFNEGIDWFAGGREDEARQWALSATALASRCHDGGKLKRQICDHFALLKLGDLEIKTSVEVDLPDVSEVLSAADEGN